MATHQVHNQTEDAGAGPPRPGEPWNGRPAALGERGWHKLCLRRENRLALAEWDPALAQWLVTSMLLWGDRVMAAGELAEAGWEYVGAYQGHPHLGSMILCGSA